MEHPAEADDCEFTSSIQPAAATSSLYLPPFSSGDNSQVLPVRRDLLSAIHTVYIKLPRRLRSFPSLRPPLRRPRTYDDAYRRAEDNYRPFLCTRCRLSPRDFVLRAMEGLLSAPRRRDLRASAVAELDLRALRQP